MTLIPLALNSAHVDFLKQTLQADIKFQLEKARFNAQVLSQQIGLDEVAAATAEDRSIIGKLDKLWSIVKDMPFDSRPEGLIPEDFQLVHEYIIHQIRTNHKYMEKWLIEMQRNVFMRDNPSQYPLDKIQTHVTENQQALENLIPLSLDMQRQFDQFIAEHTIN